MTAMVTTKLRCTKGSGSNMYYEINVSLNGKHLFATAEHSITNQSQMEKVYELFQKKFPESEGYRLDVTLWEKRGKPIIWNNQKMEA